MVIVNVDRGSAVPAYRQICDRVVELVESGALAAGDRLPPSRTLARTAGVHRTTVVRAYGELWALGYLASRPGSYSTVRRPARPAAARKHGSIAIDAAGGGCPAAPQVSGDAGGGSEEQEARDGVIEFARLAADPRLAPVDDMRRCFKEVLRENGARLLDYGDAAGYRPLRETLARRMAVHGVAVSADDILITNGAQQALDLALRLLTRRGDRIVTESPSYAAALSLFRLHGLRIQGVPMRHDGMDLRALDAALRRTAPALVYTMPNFHNPTGISTSQAHREELLGICESHRVPIVEDGFEEELKYFGKAVLPIKSMDTRGLVLYVGTFSKVVFPGLRLGWIAAPRALVERLAEIQRVSSLSGNLLAQAAAERFCGSGAYETYLRRAHGVYRKRMQTMLRSLSEWMPEGVEWTQPSGGHTLWLSVARKGASEASLTTHFLRAGVRVAPGTPFFAKPPAESHFRLSIAWATEEQIVEGCRRLGRAFEALASAGRAARAARPKRAADVSRVSAAG